MSSLWWQRGRVCTPSRTGCLQNSELACKTCALSRCIVRARLGRQCRVHCALSVHLSWFHFILLQLATRRGSARLERPVLHLLAVSIPIAPQHGFEALLWSRAARCMPCSWPEVRCPLSGPEPAKAAGHGEGWTCVHGDATFYCKTLDTYRSAVHTNQSQSVRTSLTPVFDSVGTLLQTLGACQTLFTVSFVLVHRSHPITTTVARSAFGRPSRLRSPETVRYRSTSLIAGTRTSFGSTVHCGALFISLPLFCFVSVVQSSTIPEIASASDFTHGRRKGGGNRANGLVGLPHIVTGLVWFLISTRDSFPSVICCQGQKLFGLMYDEVHFPYPCLLD